MTPPLIFEERIRAIRHRLMLIQAAAVADDSAVSVEPDDLLEAIYAASVEALDLLEPIREHISDVQGGNWIAPETSIQ